MNQPSSDVTVTQGQNVTISWDGADPDDAATVTLYYDTDNNYGNGGQSLIIGTRDRAIWKDFDDPCKVNTVANNSVGNSSRGPVRKSTHIFKPLGL